MTPLRVINRTCSFDQKIILKRRAPWKFTCAEAAQAANVQNSIRPDSGATRDIVILPRNAVELFPLVSTPELDKRLKGRTKAVLKPCALCKCVLIALSVRSE